MTGDLSQRRATLTVAQAATELGVGRSAVRKAIARGRLAATLRPDGYRGRPEYVIDETAVATYRRSRCRD